MTPSPHSSRPAQFRKKSFAVFAGVVAAGLMLGSCDKKEEQSAGYPHAKEKIGAVREVYDGTLTPDLAVATFRNIDRLFPTRNVATGGTPYPLPAAEKQLTQVKFTSKEKAYDLFDFLALDRVSGLLILKDGKIAYETYQYGNTPKTHWMSMSVAKSITSTLFGAAIKDGLISLTDPVTKYVPKLAGSAYEGVTVRDLLMMSSGVKWNETYTDPASDRRHLLEAQISQKPGSAMEVMAGLERLAPVGTHNTYSTGETQVAGEVLRGAIKKPLADYLSEKIWSKYAMETPANWWLDSPDGVEIGGSGFSATLRDYGRFGLLVMNNGVINGQSILPDGWVPEAGSAKVLANGDPLNYGYFWWIPASGPSREDGAFEGRGIQGQGLYVNQKEKVVIVVWGAQSKPGGMSPIPVMDFYDGVVAALK